MYADSVGCGKISTQCSYWVTSHSMHCSGQKRTVCQMERTNERRVTAVKTREYSPALSIVRCAIEERYSNCTLSDLGRIGSILYYSIRIMEIGVTGGVSESPSGASAVNVRTWIVSATHAFKHGAHAFNAWLVLFHDKHSVEIACHDRSDRKTWDTFTSTRQSL